MRGEARASPAGTLCPAAAAQACAPGASGLARAPVVNRAGAGGWQKQTMQGGQVGGRGPDGPAAGGSGRLTTVPWPDIVNEIEGPELRWARFPGTGGGDLALPLVRLSPPSPSKHRYVGGHVPSPATARGGSSSDLRCSESPVSPARNSAASRPADSSGPAFRVGGWSARPQGPASARFPSRGTWHGPAGPNSNSTLADLGCGAPCGPAPCGPALAT